MSRSGSTFGRDEFNALLGGGAEGTDEMAAFRPSASATSKRKTNNQGHHHKEDPDISTLTPAETAALLAEKNQGKKASQASSSSSRYRTQKVMAHHQLLEEELQLQAQQAQPIGQLAHAGARRERHLLSQAARTGETGDGVEKADLDADEQVRDVVADGGRRGIKHGSRLSCGLRQLPRGRKS